MRITCPECGFSRDVPDGRVPAATAVATCPKCRHRFRFRDVEDGFDPSSSAYEQPTSEPRFSGEERDGYAPQVGLGATPRFPGAVRHSRDPKGAAESARHGYDPYTPDAPRGHDRVFPPPSAHWEPSAPAEETPVASEESTPLRMTPHPAAMDPPPRPEHEEERLRASEPAAREPRSEARQEQNGVRDIWARLQAMDDEDAARLPPPRPAAPPAPGSPARVATAPAEEAPARRAADEPGSDPAPGPRPSAVSPSAASAPEDTHAQRPAAVPGGYSPAPGDTDDAPGMDVRGGDDTGAPDSSGSPASSDSAGPFPEGRPDDAAPGEVPWERLDAYGFFPGLVLTLKRILFQPVEFFESMPPGRGKGKAMVFNLLLSEFLLLVDFLWALLGVRAKLADTGQTDALAAMAGVPGIGFLILLLMVPVFMAAGIYLDAGLTHLLLMLLRGNSKKFDETFRVMCYSAAPTVLSAVPVAGQLLSPVILIWYMMLQAIGLKKVHGAAYSQALAVVLIKWSLYLFLLLGMLHGLSSGG